MSGAVWTVLCKELRDALRDRRTLLAIVLSSVALGPLVLVLLSTLVAGIEQRAESREVVVAGIEHAPTLHNYLLRQNHRVSPAPQGFEQLLQSKQLGEPVLVIGDGFEAELARGLAPRVELVFSSTNPRAAAGASRTAHLLQGFVQEQALLRLAWRGVAPAALQVVDVDQRDLASPAARAAQWTSLVPFFVLMAVVYGALHAALDTTAGERERGSLEPLLTNPVSPLSLVLGKWAAVAAVGMLVALLSCASFLPGQWLLRSDTLSAMFRFGVREGAMFLALLLPLAGALSALLMAIAIRCRSVKEAQANATALVLAVSLLPLVSLFSQEGEAPWHLAVPALAQITLMGRVLRGEPTALWELALPLGVCVLLVLLCLLSVARALRPAALK
ncbi:MAG TPA: ABC transporter permease subunit [Rubrivivax sp.]|nr:ABC transporter permease subunit [Rubrivivax sp.]